MKVLSITEPYATLIKNGYKKIETRSYKTSYRGELYIHASMNKKNLKVLQDQNIKNLVDTENFNFGQIICKCNLVDCVYMSKEFIAEIKKNNYQEYLCGQYEEGRYAWILADVEILDKKISAKGQLNIWNYYRIDEIQKIMDNIEYGWVDKYHNKHIDDYDTFANDYILQSPKEVLKNKVGVCWDQVELERYLFRPSTLNIYTYFIVYYDNDKYPTHTFLTYEYDNKYYWFEHSWERFKGIHIYDSKDNLLLDVKNKFIKYELDNCCNKNNLVIYEYKKPKYHLSVLDFYKHCESGKKINKSY